MSITRLSTRELLAESFEDLLLRKKLDAIYVKDIAENCGISRQTFYNYFTDINELVYWIFYQDLFRYVKNIDGVSYTWREATMDSYKLYQTRIHFYKNALEYTGQNSMKEFVVPIVQETCLKIICRKYESFVPDEEFIFALRFYLKGTVSIISEWIISGCEIAPEIMCKRVLLCMPESVRKLLL